MENIIIYFIIGFVLGYFLPEIKCFINKIFKNE